LFLLSCFGLYNGYDGDRERDHDRDRDRAAVDASVPRSLKPDQKWM